MTGNSVLIQIAGLKRHFILGETVVRALDGMDLAVEDGEFLCVMGPSGSGKSTLLNLIGGLDRPDEGTLLVAGQDITTLDENALALYRREQVGFVFQTFNLIGTMSALHNVEYPMIFARVPASTRRARAIDLLTQVGLAHRLSHKPTEMSGGEQQRVALGRSLVNDPAILLADEPTGNLDTKTGMEILSLLQEVNQRGRTVIAITHDPRVGNFASRTVHMLDGRSVSEDMAPV